MANYRSNVIFLPQENTLLSKKDRDLIQEVPVLKTEIEELKVGV